MTPKPVGRTLKPAFETSLSKYAGRVAVRHGQSTLTYDQLNQRSNAVASQLFGSGIHPGDRVGLMLSNSIQYVVVDLAIIKSGGSKLLLNTELSDDDLRFMIRDSGCRTIFCESDSVSLRSELMDESTALEECIVLGGDEELPTGFVQYESYRSGGDEAAAPTVTVSPDDEGGLFYTSGTTGRPKGVRHTQESRTRMAHAIVMELGFDGDDRVLLETPLRHAAGAFLWGALLTGATTVIRDGFDAETMLADIEREAITWTFLVPTMLYRILDLPTVEEYDVSSIDTIAYGAAPVTPDRLREGLGVFGPVFVQFYGQAEVPMLISSLGKAEHARALESGREEWLSSAGQSCLMSEVRIVDVDSGDVLPAGAEGEIEATATYRMAGYHGSTEDSETLRDGWVRTGDIGKLDEDGYLYLLDRKADMIVTGGLNVFTSEVEDAVAEHPSIETVAVVGVPDEEWGEAVTALVVADEPVDREALDSFLEDRLAAYKRPKQVEMVDEIPATPYGKVDKEAIEERFWSDTDRNIN